MLSVLTALVAVGATVAAGFAVAHNALSHIRRIHVAYLEPMGGPSGPGLSVLITSSNGSSAAPSSSTSPAPSATGLIMILHVNADHQAGGVVSIRPTTVVAIPGHGRQEISNSVNFGGPSLLVQTVEQVTHVPINHFARINFAGVSNLIGTIGGVDVSTPSGTVHMDGAAALAYARNASLTENQRVLRQQSLIRAILRKIADEHLLTSPATMVHVLNALTSMLTVDSSFTDAQVASLAKELGGMSSSGSTFVTAPVRHMLGEQVFTGAAHQLWVAIRQDAIAAWARAHPQWVTPETVP